MGAEGGIANVAGKHHRTYRVALHAAATATEVFDLEYFPNAINIVAAYHSADAAVSGQDTNTTHLNLHDRGTDGTGTSEIANIDYTDGIDIVAHDANAMTLTAANTGLAAGSMLALQYEKVGTGLAIGVGNITIEFEYQ